MKIARFKKSFRLTILAGLFFTVTLASADDEIQPDYPKDYTVKRFSIGAYWIPTACDCASLNDFQPGPGRSEGTDDRHWRLRLQLDEPKEIASISVILNDGSQAWSTYRDAVGEVAPDPLVVYFNGQKLTEYYDQVIGDLGTGILMLDLFGQMDTKSFPGGKLIVTFIDGAVKSASINRVPNNSDDAACPADCAAPVIEYDGAGGVYP